MYVICRLGVSQIYVGCMSDVCNIYLVEIMVVYSGTIDCGGL